MTWRGSRLLKHFLQYVLIMLTWYTCLSRISDYKHHWSDVLTGAALGAICAMIVVSNAVNPAFYYLLNLHFLQIHEILCSWFFFHFTGEFCGRFG